MAGARDVANNESGPARRARDDMNKLTRLPPGSDATPSPPPDPPALGALVDRVLALLLAENAHSGTQRMPTVAPLVSQADPTPADATAWTADLQALLGHLGRHFARSETRAHLRAYLTGLLSPIERKNGWQLAEHAGDSTPYGIQHLLDRAQWDADAVRDDLQAYVRDRVGHPAGVLVIDETSFLKKGTHSVGVGVQYSGVTGTLTNCQVGVFLAYVSPRGQTLYDRALYLPRDWAKDPERRARAGVPAGVRFATKPKLATALVLRALGGDLPVAWVTGDEVYGGDYHLRAALEAREQPYALTVSANHAVAVGWRQRQARTLVAAAPAGAWERHSCSDGSKGPQRYDWLRLPINQSNEAPWQRWLVARRDLAAPDDPRCIAYFLVFAPAQTSLAALAAVIGERWGIECAFEESKGAVGLDQYEVRSWHGWHRHVTLAMWAHAFLAVRHAGTLAAHPLVRGRDEGEKQSRQNWHRIGDHHAQPTRRTHTASTRSIAARS
jgi:SRSO17 transposase